MKRMDKWWRPSSLLDLFLKYYTTNIIFNVNLLQMTHSKISLIFSINFVVCFSRFSTSLVTLVILYLSGWGFQQFDFNFLVHLSFLTFCRFLGEDCFFVLLPWTNLTLEYGLKGKTGRRWWREMSKAESFTQNRFGDRGEGFSSLKSSLFNWTLGKAGVHEIFDFGGDFFFTTGSDDLTREFEWWLNVTTIFVDDDSGSSKLKSNPLSFLTAEEQSGEDVEDEEGELWRAEGDDIDVVWGGGRGERGERG